jgi:hypothetical protein
VIPPGKFIICDIPSASIFVETSGVAIIIKFSALAPSSMNGLNFSLTTPIFKA